jgi:CGA synthase-related protein
VAVLTPAAARRRAPAVDVLLACETEQLDSLLALRRIAAHLDGVPTREWVGSQEPGERLPGAALVCGDAASGRRLTELGVPVVQVPCGLPGGDAPPGDPGPDLARAHWPGWLAHPVDARVTGLLAPARLTRRSRRQGTLLLLSAWQVPEPELAAFTGATLPALARQAVRRTGSCEVVCDTGVDVLREALTGLDGVRVHRAAEADVDELHARAGIFLAAPSVAALAVAQSRRAPLVFVPPLGPAQRQLAGLVAQRVPVPFAEDPADPALWDPHEAEPGHQWSGLDPDLDDLRGAQRIARTLRQLVLAPP